jgi:hypothetical protein
VVGKEIAAEKYAVRLSAEERAQLDELIRKGKHSAQLLTKARILLKADVSELGEGCGSRSDPDQILNGSHGHVHVNSAARSDKSNKIVGRPILDHSIFPPAWTQLSIAGSARVSTARPALDAGRSALCHPNRDRSLCRAWAFASMHI